MRPQEWKEKFGKFRRLDGADKRLFIHAVTWLFMARLMVLIIPFRRLANWSASKNDAQASAPPELIERISFAVSAAANNVPWRADCFPQSIAASKLLKRYGYSSTIHLGVANDGEATIAGHAWLTCGETVVTGGEGLDRYTEMHRLSV